jgi:transcriptional/translational regulatory protein YebC/TACO1
MKASVQVAVAIIVLTETDNPNRTVTEIRTIFRDNHGNLGTPGTANWKFTTQAVMHASSPKVSTPAMDEIELALIDSDATDIRKDGHDLTVTGSPDSHTILEDNPKKI